MEIGEQLTLLAELSNVEQKLKAAKDAAHALGAAAEAAEQDAAEKRQRVSVLEQRHTELEMQRRAMDSDLAVERDKLRKWQARADQIRGEREHAALASEIGAQKRSITHLENDTLEKMQELEDAAKELEAAQQSLAAAEGRVAEERAKIGDELKTAEADVAQHDKSRRALVEKLPPPLVKRYERIADKRGHAVAVIHGEMCTSCKRTLPPQLCIQIYRGQALETCPSCQRILVHEAMTRAPEGEESGAPQGASA